MPQEHRLHRFKWLFQDERSSAGGRGSARIAPPDSLRFDVAGPFGSGAASAAVIGDQPLWAEPPDAMKKLVPNYPLMWAMFGVARLPAEGDELRGAERRRADRLAVRRRRRHGRVCAHRRAAPVKLVARGAPRAARWSGGRRRRSTRTGAALTARLTVPSVPAQLDLTFLSTAQADFAPDIWASRKP